MKLTRASSYALYAVVHIAREKPTAPLASHEVAQAHKIPERFLLKVLKPLVSAGILASVKGPRGGYRLAKKPSEITMLEIIEAIEGPIRGMASFHSQAGSNGLQKKLDSVFAAAAEHTRKQLGQVRLSHLIDL
jgi:Rrf2 family protein